MSTTNTSPLQYNLAHLQTVHAHPRDAAIRFFEQSHKYEIVHDSQAKYLSVTTFVHQRFPRFDADEVIRKMVQSAGWGPSHKYWGQTSAQIKAGWNASGAAASAAGTALHARIEAFMNQYEEEAEGEGEEGRERKRLTHADLYRLYKAHSLASHSLASHSHDEEGKTEAEAKGAVDGLSPDTAIEWNYFLAFVKDHPDMVPYRTEWRVYDEDLKMAGSIDMVYENPDGTLAIYDWKRVREIKQTNEWRKFATDERIGHVPDTNYWHYALQLNLYKTILERRYGKTVSSMVLVRLHPEAETASYELVSVPPMVHEISDLLEPAARFRLDDDGMAKPDLEK